MNTHNKPLSIAIIGCGIAGSSLARMLSDLGNSVSVTLFDKGRQPGGRMSTRSRSHLYDHGAQYFTVRTRAFAGFLESYQEHYQLWEPRVTTLAPNRKPYKRPWFEPHYVATPGMNSLCDQITAGLPMHLSHKINAVTGVPGQWFLESDDALSGPFDWVISTAPAPQSETLLGVNFKAAYAPVFALMAPIVKRPDFDAAAIKDSPLKWLTIADSRPGRSGKFAQTLVALSREAWAHEVLEIPPEDVKRQMLDALTALSIDVDEQETKVHRWRFATVTDPTEEPFYCDVQQQLAACGDWCVGTGVEEAFTSANELFYELQPLFKAGVNRSMAS